MSRPRRWRSASCSRAAAPKRSNTGRRPPAHGSARKEILVSSGAYNSPQLLQLSGVGPADLLKQHGIEIVLDAPGVGSDLQDHLQVRVITRCAQRVTLNDVVNNPLRRVWAACITRRCAGAADDRGRHLGRLLQDQSAAGNAGYPDPLHPVLDRQDGRKTACVFRLHRLRLPASAREPRLLRIRSADPQVAPEIRINYLATETDRRAFIDGIRILRNILAAPALKSYCVEEVDPGAKTVSDEDLLEFCRRTGSTVYHPTSTCRMGNDPLAVVDQRLKVRGIDGLRVVDASIMPDLMSGNTNAPTIMIAEKASDMILEDAR
jgi:choline dehydrogenase